MDINQQLNKILPLVEKPGRYTGGEFNQIVKNWESTDLKIVLAFPDVYDIGLPNLGLAILYSEINNRDDCLAERVYAPWKDFEALLRSNSVPLYSLENKRTLKDFDLIGFSLPYETLYTNVLNMLDLAHISAKSENRLDTDPIIIAGGHATFNPEPMHAFIDAFVIGEGEQVIHEIIESIKFGKASGISKSDIIASFSNIQGVYVPSLSIHDEFSIPPQNISHSQPKEIQKRIVHPLPPHITEFLVPNVDIVQNRVSIEIMRGCTRGCRFCQAGMVTRPVRERSRTEILRAAEEALISTGYEDISLLSLSTSDYSKITELLIELQQIFSEKDQKLSFPSLRIESFTSELMNTFAEQRKGNFTLAPEAATEQMRNRINKSIRTQDLLQTVENIYKRGWESIKLYFMIGFPEETIEDVQAIVDACIQVRNIGKKLIGNRVRLSVSVNTLIPKPHTPFQWVPFAKREEIYLKHQLLRNQLSLAKIKVSLSNYDASLLEALLSRGNRKTSDIIFSAWQAGAKFDAWYDQFDAQIWQSAFHNQGIDYESYLSSGFDLDSMLPWDHISTGVTKNFLKEEYLNSAKLKTLEDCRLGCFSCGIQTAFNITCKNVLQHG